MATIRTARLLLITQGTAVSHRRRHSWLFLRKLTDVLQTVLHSLKAAGGLLLQVSFFIAFVALLLAIAGVQSFSGSFNRSCQMYSEFRRQIGSVRFPILTSCTTDDTRSTWVSYDRPLKTVRWTHRSVHHGTCCLDIVERRESLRAQGLRLSSRSILSGWLDFAWNGKSKGD